MNIFYKSFFLFLLFVSLIFSGCRTKEKNSGIIILNTGWKYSINDSSSVFVSPEYNSFHWKALRNVSDIEDLFPDSNQIIWLRNKIILPQSLYENSFFKDNLEIIIEGLDIEYQLFLNEKTLQKPESTIKTSNETQTKYQVPVNDPSIKWNQVNVISLRLKNYYSTRQLYNFSVQISMRDLKNYLHLDSETYPARRENNHFVKNIVIKNNFNQNLKGKLTISVINSKRDEIVYYDDRTIKLAKHSQKEHQFSFKVEKGNKYRIIYVFLPKIAENAVMETEIIQY